MKILLFFLTSILLCSCNSGNTASAAPTPDIEQQSHDTAIVWHTSNIEALAKAESESFTISPITDEIFARIKGKSFGSDCTIPRSSLRYLQVLHYDGRDSVRIGELICNKAIAPKLIDIFRKLYHARYPIEKMRLIDDYNADDEASMADNNTSCFNFRKVEGSKNLSNHARGMAIDLNPLYNPFVRKRANGTLHVSPENGRPYANRTTQSPYPLINTSDLAYRLFTKAGFRWGGNWRSYKDYQHFDVKIP